MCASRASSLRWLRLNLQRSYQGIVLGLSFIQFQENLIAVLHASQAIYRFLAAFLVKHLVLLFSSGKVLIDRFERSRRSRVIAYFLTDRV